MTAESSGSKSPEERGVDDRAVEAPGCTDQYTRHDLRQQRRFLLWLAAAALAYVAVSVALRRRASIPDAALWIVVAVALLLAVQATRRYWLFLRGADELLRRIETEALAFGFGAGLAFALFYPVLQELGAPPLGLRAVAVVMMLAWSASSWFGTRRYSGRDAP